MQKFNEKKLSQIKKVPKQRQKLFQSKPIKVKSHIIFKGDPAFHQNSIDYKPVERRKKIFQDHQENVLPAQLLQNSQALIEHSSRLQGQQQINQNIIDNFDQQINLFGSNINANRNRNLKKRLTSQQQELYFEPNNLQSDINFGVMYENNYEADMAIHSSKASQITQKKGQIYINNPNELIAAKNVVNAISPTTQPITGKVVNFSYQGQNFQNQDGQIIESRVKKVTTVQNKVPQKSNAKTIFVNEGGVLVPKKNKKIEMQNSDYYDFDGINHENNEKNQSLINELRLTDTPQFNMRNGKSSDIIHNFINQDYKGLDSERNLEKYRKSMSDGTKIFIESRNSASKLNNVNSSNVSYKSIQKHFQLQHSQPKPPSESYKSIPQKKTNSQAQLQQVLLNQLFQTHMQDKRKNNSQDSMSFHQQDGGSLFDKILQERQNIFNKNKQPQVQLKRKEVTQKRGSMIKINGSFANFNQSNSVHKPNDFITDSKLVSAGHKRSINIHTVPIMPTSQHKKQQNQNKILPGSPILQSKVKRLEIKNETQEHKSKFAPSKEEINQVQYKKVTKKNVKNKNMPNRNSNQSIPQSVGYEDDQDLYQIDYQNQEQEDYIQEQQSSQQQSSVQQKKRKLNKSKRKNSKQLIKKKIETQQQLQDYLKQEKQRIQLKQIEKIMDNVPQIRDNLNKKSKKNKNKKVSQVTKQQINKIAEVSEGQQQPVVYTAPNQLNPLQRQLLQTVGIKLIENAIGKSSQDQMIPPNNQIGNQYSNQSQAQTQNMNGSMHQQFQQNLPMFFNHHRQLLQKQNGIQQGVSQINKNINPTIPISLVEQYNQNYEKQFQQITKALYNQLNKYISTLPPNSSHFPTQNGLVSTSNHTQSPSIQIGSAFSFKNHKPLQQQQIQKPNIKVNQPRNEFQRPNPIQTKYLSKQRTDLYNREIYDELIRFNSVKNNIKQNSRQKSRLTFEGSQQNDDSQYYSFYHDDQEPKYNNKSSTTFQYTDNYYPLKKQKTRQKQMPLQKSFKSRYELKSNSELGLLNQKVQQLTKEIHQQLPQIRKQIQQNQQQIRKIQTHLLIKNTAEQHTLIKILQKMKLKDLELQQKQIQTKNKDHQLSMYQNQLASLKTQYLGNTNQMIQNLQMQNYFQNRLYKIKNYNENLFLKLSKHKVSPQKIIIPQRQPTPILIQKLTKTTPQRHHIPIQQKYSKRVVPQRQYHFI